MPRGPDPLGPGRDEDPAREPGEPVPAPDAMTGKEEWLAWCESAAGQDEPPGPDEEEDPGSAAPWDYDLDAIIAECRRITAEEAAACARGGAAGPARRAAGPLARRGPGEPGSARRSPGST